jgi:hypothetical protein
VEKSGKEWKKNTFFKFKEWKRVKKSGKKKFKE